MHTYSPLLKSNDLKKENICFFKPIQNKTYGVETAPDEQKENGDQELLHGESVDSGWRLQRTVATKSPAQYPHKTTKRSVQIGSLHFPNRLYTSIVKRQYAGERRN